MGLPILKMATVGILPSGLKKTLYRLRGAKIGKNVSLGMFSILVAKEIEIDDNSSIGPFSFILADKIKIGKRSKVNALVAIETGFFEMKNDSVVMEQVVIGGMLTPRSGISIGNNVKIFPYSFINPTEKVTIEDEVGVGGANYIFTHGSWQSKLDGFPVSFGPVTIKKGVWLPWRVFIMPNVTINEYATIGAGSIITKDIPERSLAAGSPAKVLRTGDEYIKQHDLHQKTEIVLDILKEYTDYLSHIGTKAQFVSDESFPSKITNKEFTLLFFDKKPESGFQTDSSVKTVILSLSEIEKNDRNQLSSKGIAWFDLEKKESFFENTKAWLFTKDFLSRYGIRFYTFPD